MVLFLRNKRFNVMLFWAYYYLRWWRLPIEGRACCKTDLGGGDYYLRNSGLPPSLDQALMDSANKSDCSLQRHLENGKLGKFPLKRLLIGEIPITEEGDGGEWWESVWGGYLSVGGI